MKNRTKPIWRVQVKCSYWNGVARPEAYVVKVSEAVEI